MARVKSNLGYRITISKDTYTCVEYLNTNGLAMPPARGRPKRRACVDVPGYCLNKGSCRSTSNTSILKSPEKMSLKELKEELVANSGEFPSWAKRKALVLLVKRGRRQTPCITDPDASIDVLPSRDHDDNARHDFSSVETMTPLWGGSVTHQDIAASVIEQPDVVYTRNSSGDIPAHRHPTCVRPTCTPDRSTIGQLRAQIEELEHTIGTLQHLGDQSQSHTPRATAHAQFSDQVRNQNDLPNIFNSISTTATSTSPDNNQLIDHINIGGNQVIVTGQSTQNFSRVHV